VCQESFGLQYSSCYGDISVLHNIQAIHPLDLKRLNAQRLFAAFTQAHVIKKFVETHYLLN